MFTRPQSPARIRVIGICGVVFGLVSVPLVFTDFTVQRSLEPLIIGMILLLWLLGIYFIVLGSIWIARDRARS